MPSVKYSFILSNAQGYEGIEEELKLTAEMDIPDGYDDVELKQVINEMQAELPYFQYQNVIVQVIEVQVQEKPVKVFAVKGDNIGKEQINYISRVYKHIAMDVMLKRSKTTVIFTNPQVKTRFEKMPDVIKNVFNYAKETFSRLCDRLLKKQKTWEEAREEARQHELVELERKAEEEKLYKQRMKELEYKCFLEKQKITRLEIEERLEKLKLARLKKEAAIKAAIQKEEKKELKKRNKELETLYQEAEAKNKKLKTQFGRYEDRIKSIYAKVESGLEVKNNFETQYDELEILYQEAETSQTTQGGMER